MRTTTQRNTNRSTRQGEGSAATRVRSAVRGCRPLGTRLGGRAARGVLGALLVAVLATSASALQYQNGDFTFDFDTTLSYGAAWRLADRDDYLLAGSDATSRVSYENRNDGDQNFDKGDLVTNRLSVIADIDVKYKTFGAFLRPKYFYDWAYNGTNANDSPETNNNGPLYGGPLGENDHFTKETKDAHRDRFELLDAFAYGSHTFGGIPIDVRVGRQVVSWGESLFLTNGVSSAQSPIDATQAFAPGVELRDIFLPTNQVLARVGLGANFSIAGYYQWEWKPSRLPEAGSYYSSVDYADDAGNRVLVPVELAPGLAVRPTIDRGDDEDARDSGQWGVAVRYLAEWLGSTEFGLYYLNYHEKAPEIRSAYAGGNASPTMTALGGTWGNLPTGLPAPADTLGAVSPVTAFTLDLLDTSSYWLKYDEDIKLIGLSAGTVVADANVGFEVSYRKDVPIGVNDPLVPLALGYEKGGYYQAQMSILDVFPGTFLYDQLTVGGEIGCGLVKGIDSDDLYETVDIHYTKFSWGYLAQLSFDWFNVFQGVDLNVPVTYAGNPQGTSPLGTFSEGQESFAVGLGITYLKNAKATISYTNYVGGPHHNALDDRDTLSVNLKYTF